VREGREEGGGREKGGQVLGLHLLVQLMNLSSMEREGDMIARVTAEI